MELLGFSGESALRCELGSVARRADGRVARRDAFAAAGATLGCVISSARPLAAFHAEFLTYLHRNTSRRLDNDHGVSQRLLTVLNTMAAIRKDHRGINEPGPIAGEPGFAWWGS